MRQPLKEHACIFRQTVAPILNPVAPFNFDFGIAIKNPNVKIAIADKLQEYISIWYE